VLTPQQDAVIYAAIHADSTIESFARVGNDSEVAARLNSQTVTVYRRVSAAQLLRWSALRNVMQKLQSEASNGTNGKKSIAQAALTMLSAGVSELPLDAEIIAMIDVLVGGNVLTADDKADLLARAAEQIGLAESLVGQAVNIEDIGRILAVDRPDGKIPKEAINGGA
jgi:hypothetical protein